MNSKSILVIARRLADIREATRNLSEALCDADVCAYTEEIFNAVNEIFKVLESEVEND